VFGRMLPSLKVSTHGRTIFKGYTIVLDILKFSEDKLHVCIQKVNTNYLVVAEPNP
jgi:hypothetical protein